MKGRVTHETRRGPRGFQEDRFVIIRVEGHDCFGWLLGVFDGHEGTEVSEFCAGEAINVFNLTDADHAEGSLRDMITNFAHRTDQFEAGSTVSIALVLESHNKVSVAVLGDSPVVVLDKNGQFHVGPEHNVRSNAQERIAVETRGGVYIEEYIYAKDGEHGVQLSRALGDVNLGDVISRVPDVYTIEDPQWVLVASDGIFDPAHKKAANLIEEVKVLAIDRAKANRMIDWAEKRELQDNATALVWSRNWGLLKFLRHPSRWFNAN